MFIYHIIHIYKTDVYIYTHVGVNEGGRQALKNITMNTFMVLSELLVLQDG